MINTSYNLVFRTPLYLYIFINYNVYNVIIVYWFVFATVHRCQNVNHFEIVIIK